MSELKSKLGKAAAGAVVLLLFGVAVLLLAGVVMVIAGGLVLNGLLGAGLDPMLLAGVGAVVAMLITAFGAGGGAPSSNE